MMCSINLSPSESNEEGGSITLINVLVRLIGVNDIKSSPVPTESDATPVEIADEIPEEDHTESSVKSLVEAKGDFQKAPELGFEVVSEPACNEATDPITSTVNDVQPTPLPSVDVPLPSTDAPLSPANAPLPSTDAPLPPANAPLPPANAPLSPPDTPLPSANAPLPSADVQEMSGDDDTLIMMDSDDSDNVDTATLNDLALHSLQRRARLLSANNQDSSVPSHSRNCLSADFTQSSPPLQSQLESTFSYCPILQLLHEGDVSLLHSIHL